MTINNFIAHEYVNPPRTFKEGYCECGNEIFQLVDKFGHNNKYRVGTFFEQDDPAHPIMWRWVCKGCGRMHYEPSEIIMHECV